jgi:hypothetical protein
LRGYLIRLAHGYMDGGMDSLAEEERNNVSELVANPAINSVYFIFSANVRSAVRVFTGEAGVTFALLLRFLR